MELSARDISKLKCIHKGTKSFIYRQDTSKYGVPIAIKLLMPHDHNLKWLIRFNNEYELTKMLNFPGIRRTFDRGKIDGWPFLVLEYVEGVTVSRAFVKQRQSLELTLSAAVSISRTLEKIHQHKIIHKDINSTNILINIEKQAATIIDFGIASEVDFKTRGQEKPKTLEGTIQYISPEQTGRLNRFIDYRTDFYSLGVTLYEMFTGRVPFDIDDFPELVHCHLAKRPVPVNKINPDIPQAVSDIIMKLLAKNADERYQSAYGLSHDLENCLHQLQSTGNIKRFALAQYDFSGRFTIPQTLYGREKEIQVLMEAFAWIKKGAAEILLISGEAGSGKSSLVSEIQKTVIESRGYFIKGEQDQYKQNVPYNGLIQALKSLVDMILMENDEQLSQWNRAIQKALGNNGKLLTDVIPSLEMIIGKQETVHELAPTEALHRFHFAFLRFIKTVATKEHPLVLFIDNFQWIDSASLDLSRLIMTDLKSNALLVIGAYRDNEVTTSHPLLKTFEELKENHVFVDSLHLSNLSHDALNHLICDTLQEPPSQILPLTDLIYEKTGGNAFLSIQLLKSLYEEGLLFLDHDKRQWSWEINKIKERGISDNVEVILFNRITRLPDGLQELLMLASCIGERFELGMLSTLAGKSLSDVYRTLKTAIDERIIIPIDNNYKILLAQEEGSTAALQSEFEFLHRSLRQTTYSMIPKKKRQELLLAIGQVQLQSLSGDQVEENIFDIVDHYNKGFRYIKDNQELKRLAELNFIAGRKAKKSMAYREAIWYLSMGIGFLSPGYKWEVDYQLTVNLYLEAVEAEYLSSNYERTELLSDEILRHAKTLQLKIRVYRLQILSYTSQNLNEKAIEVALTALKMLGINMMTEIKQIRNNKDILWHPILQEIKQIDDLANLPEMHDQKILSAMQILMDMSAPCHQAHPNLLPVIVLTMVDLSVKHGNSPLAAFAYGWYSILLCVAIGDIDKGYQFGLLSIEVLECFNATELKAKVFFLFNASVRHYKEHAATTIKPLQNVYEYGLESGDLEYAYYGAIHSFNYQIWLGHPLENILEKQLQFLETTEKYRLKFHNSLARIWTQLTQNLLGQVADPCQLKGDSFDETVMLPLWQEQNNIMLVFFTYCCKTILNYLFGNYAEAVKSAQQGENYDRNRCGFIYRPLFYFYYALSLLANCSEVEAETQKKYLAKVKEIQEKIRSWSKHAPMNYQHKYNLVQAEIARISGEPYKAIELYGKAINGARKEKYTQDLALAYEREALFYLSFNRQDFARFCITEAKHYYHSWGAAGKVQNLERNYPQLFNWIHLNGEPMDNFDTSSETEIEALDIETVIKTSQVISSEIYLGDLLKKLIRIVIENAGAQKGFLVLERERKWVIEAEGYIEKPEAQVLQSISIEASDAVSTGIIFYAARSKENVILNDAANEGNFTNDPYIRKNQTKSVLCLPLLNRDRISGILYMENNLTTDAFTPNRLELLNVLSSQMAMSLDNALLYQEAQHEIEERKQAEEALRVSEERLALAMEASGSGVYDHFEPIEKGAYQSERWASILGYKREELPPPEQFMNWFFGLVHPDDVPRFEKAYSDFVEGRSKIYNVELRMKHVSGKWIYVQVFSKAVERDEQGRVTRIVGVMQDITEEKHVQEELIRHRENLEVLVRKRTEALEESRRAALSIMQDAEVQRQRAEDTLVKLEESHQEINKLSQALKQSPATVVITDPEGNIEYVNPIFTKITGYTPSEAIGKNPRILKSGDLPDSYYKNLWDTILSRKTWRGEFKNKKKNGKIYWESASISPILNDEGEIIHFVAVKEDITERKKLENELNKSRERLDLALRAANLGLWDFYPQTGEQNINDTWAEMLGYKQEEITNNVEEWSKRVHPDDYKSTWSKFLEHAEGKLPIYRSEHRLRTRSGKYKWILTIGRAVERDEQGSPVRVVGIHMDIDERKDMERKLALAKEVAEEATKAKSEFLANMSHEIRTPMNAITGMIYMLLQGDMTRKQTEYVHKIQSASNNLLGIINDILDFSKIEAGKMEIESTPFELDDVLKNVSDMTAVKAEEKGLEFIISTDSDVPQHLIGDPLRLNQILTNLTSNAVKFTQSGGITISTRLGKKLNKKAKLLFSVRDSGIGMDEEQKNKIFKTFSQVDSSITRKYGGTGLGLIICKRLVEKMGGEIWVESEPGKGTTFSFSVEFGLFPGKVPQKYSKECKNVPRLPEKFARIRGAKILLVEDNLINQQVAMEILESEGFQVTIAENGEQAVAVVQSNDFDVVLMDLHMPVMDGCAAALKIRKKEKFKDLPIIAMTGDAIAGVKAKTQEAGMNDYITKPVNPEHLFTTLVKWIKPGDRESFVPAREAGDAFQKDKSKQFNGLQGIINVKDGLRRVNDNEALYRKLLQRFLQSHTTFIQELLNVLNRNDVELAIRMVHSVKGVSGNIGADSVSKSAKELESALKAGDEKKCLQHIKSLKKELKKILSGISQLDLKVETASAASPKGQWIDVTDLAPQLNKLAVELSEFDTAAVTSLKKIMANSLDPEILKAFAGVKNFISDYDFHEALNRLRQLAEQWKIKLKI